VVPEVAHMEPQILSGEAPDPTRIPSGCRFHPRCPVVASGEAERMGIEARCRGEDLALESVPGAAAGSAHVAACHAVHAPGRVEAAEARARAEAAALPDVQARAAEAEGRAMEAEGRAMEAEARATEAEARATEA